MTNRLPPAIMQYLKCSVITTQPVSKNTYTMKAIIRYSGLLLILWASVWNLHAQTESSVSFSSFQHNQALNRSPTSYQMVDETLEGEPGQTKIALRIIVSEKHSKESLTLLLQQLSTSIRARIEFQTGAPLQNIVIWAYISKTHVHSQALWLANLEQVGNSKAVIRFNELQLQELRSLPEQRFGLSEEQRKQVWQELNTLQATAKKEATARYPLDPSNFKHAEQRFQLSKRTTLILAEAETPDLLADMTGAVSLIPQTVITLRHSTHLKGRPWHYVEASSPIGEPSEIGWIDSLALASQMRFPDEAYYKNIQTLADELDFEYKFGLLEKYQISFRHLDHILIEGVFKKWPL